MFYWAFLFAVLRDIIAVFLVDMVYSDYCLIDIRFLFTFYVWMVSSTYLGPRHIHLSFHFCFKFSSVFSYVSKILVSFISPRHPVKQSLKDNVDVNKLSKDFEDSQKSC